MRIEIEFAADFAELRVLRAIVSDLCDPAAADSSEKHQIVQAVDEAVTNAIVHAYGGDSSGRITVAGEAQNGTIAFRISDAGRSFEFDPAVRFDLDRHLETGKRGGLGLHMIRLVADEVSYVTQDGRNTLSFRRRWRNGRSQEAA